MARYTQLAAAILVVGLVPEDSLGQAPAATASKLRVAAQVAASSVYDGNLFFRPQPTSDFLWRVSPAFLAQRRSTRLNLSSFFTFDAERFHEHDELSTPLARLTTSIDALARPTPRTTLVFNGGYANTATAADLNVTTGLAADRVRGWEWHGGPEIRRAVTPVVATGAGYQFRGQFTSSDVAAATHEAGVWITCQRDARNEIRGKAVGEVFVFDPGRTITSQTLLLGVTHRTTEAIAVKVDGGVRYTRGSLRPELVATIVQRARNREVTFAYAVGHATAIGLPTLVEVQRAHIEVAYHPSVRTRAAVRGAVFVNESGTGGSARVYQLSASMVRAIAGPLSFSIGYGKDLQRGEIDGRQRANPRIERNVLSVSLVVLPLATLPAK